MTNGVLITATLMVLDVTIAYATTWATHYSIKQKMKKIAALIQQNNSIIQIKAALELWQKYENFLKLNSALYPTYKTFSLCSEIFNNIKLLLDHKEARLSLPLTDSYYFQMRLSIE